LKENPLLLLTTREDSIVRKQPKSQGAKNHHKFTNSTAYVLKTGGMQERRLFGQSKSDLERACARGRR
jgi:hypothetical protein